MLAGAWWFIFNPNDRVFASIREEAARAQHAPAKEVMPNDTTRALVAADELATRV